MGLYAGRLLADFGGDVVKVESPEGNGARLIGPFKDDIPNKESSLYFLNFNTNKRGITLNLHSSAGHDIFKQLVTRADVVVEDFEPGVMESLELGYPVLRELNQGVVMTSITGFGPSGPYSGYKANDIVIFAMGGQMFMSGDPERPPLVAPAEQANHNASILACFGTLVALYHRLSTGVGQLVEVSAQEAIAIEHEPIMRYSVSSEIIRRSGSQHAHSAPSRTYPCKDGYVRLAVFTLSQWRRLVEVLGHPEVLNSELWDARDFRLLNVDVIDAIIADFTKNYTKTEFTELCQARLIPCAQVNTPEEFVNNPHVKELGLISEVEHPVVGRHRYLRNPCMMDEMLCRVQRSAPLLGQHNEEIYCGELGYSSEELAKFIAGGII